MSAIATIDLDALSHNFSLIRTKLPHHPIIAMVKANAYGHGAIAVAQALAKADAFGVATLSEAIELRHAGIKQEIILMPGFAAPNELPILLEHRLTSVIHNAQQVEILEAHPLRTPLKIWMKLDTGMHRLGFLPASFKEMHQRLEQCFSVQKPISLMTHLATADWLHSPMIYQQLACFTEQVREYKVPKSVANSALILGDFPLMDAGEWLRPGIMLYGVSPFAGTTGAEYGLKPVMSLRAKLIEVKLLSRGDKVGYGCSWQAPEDMCLGVADIGYGDGYPRSIKNGTPILVNGVRCSIVGRVSMDLITIDLRSCPAASVGDTVILWGDGLTVEEIAMNAESFPYEILSGITGRVARAINNSRS